MANNQEMAQRHISELYLKLLKNRMSYDGRRTFVVKTHDWYESNGTLPQFARDLHPAVCILRVDGDVVARSPH